jgi:hypothetical protein
VEVLSRAKGRVLARLTGRAKNDRFGAAVASLASTKRSEATLIAVGVPGADLAEYTPGVVEIYDCENWRLIQTFEQQDRGPVRDGKHLWSNAFYGATLLSAGDLNQDEREELLIGVPAGFSCGGEIGSAELRCGRSGERMQSLDNCGVERTDLSPFQFGSSLTLLGRMTPYEFPILAIGAPDFAFRGAVLLIEVVMGTLLEEVDASSMASRQRTDEVQPDR